MFVCRLMFKSEAVCSELDMSLAVLGANGAVYLRYALFVLLFLGTVPRPCSAAMHCIVFSCAHLSGHMVGGFGSITVIPVVRENCTG